MLLIQREASGRVEEEIRATYPDMDGPLTRYAGIRVMNFGWNVLRWSEETGQPLSEWDLCLACAEPLKKNPHAYDRVSPPRGQEPIGNAGRYGPIVHPFYEGDEEYICEICGCRLGEE